MKNYTHSDILDGILNAMRDKGIAPREQQKTPHDLTRRGSMRFKKRVFCSPCKATGIDFALNSTDCNGMNGAGLLCLKSALTSKHSTCYQSACRLPNSRNWSN